MRGVPVLEFSESERLRRDEFVVLLRQPTDRIFK